MGLTIIPADGRKRRPLNSNVSAQFKMNRRTIIIILIGLLASPKIALAFDPEAEGTIILFSHACLKLYPAGNSAIDSWLANPGIEQLPKAEATKFTRTRQSRAFSINSVKRYILALEDDNLCTVFAEGVNRKNVFSTWELVRKGLASDGVLEKVEEKISGISESRHYSYSDKSEKLIMRITITTKDSKAEETDFALSVVSSMREKNK